jgi:hypothetical protein
MLEYIVRPFQAPTAHGTIIIPSTVTTESTESAVISWGGEATLPETNFSTLTVNFATCKEDSKELRRDTETVRITGNDPENWVDVNRATKLYLEKQEENWKNNPANSGQTDYAADIGNFAPSEGFSGEGINDAQKCAVTMKLNNNTAAAGS